MRSSGMRALWHLIYRRAGSAVAALADRCAGAGSIAFIGMLIWHGWLGVWLLRSMAAPVVPASEPTRV
jgi:hypothetical protein